MWTCKNWWLSTHSTLTVFSTTCPRILRVSDQSPTRLSSKSSRKIVLGPSGDPPSNTAASAGTSHWLIAGSSSQPQRLPHQPLDGADAVDAQKAALERRPGRPP